MNAAANVCPNPETPSAPRASPTECFVRLSAVSSSTTVAFSAAATFMIFRALRRERDKAKSLNLWTKICRLELVWHMEDEEKPPAASHVSNLKEPSPIFLTRALSRVAKFSRQRCAPAANASRRKRLHRRRTR